MFSLAVAILLLSSPALAFRSSVKIPQTTAPLASNTGIRRHQFSPAISMMAVAIDAKTVKSLRDKTGAGMMDCKKALQEHDGDMDAAIEMLRVAGLAKADKKSSRKASEGMIETYVHTGSKLGVMVEVNCETDFVARNPEFQSLCKSIAMQIAACPAVEFVTMDDIPEDFKEMEIKIEMQKDDLEGKPQEIKEKIVKGRIDKVLKTRSLYDQPYIRDPNMSTEDLVVKAVSTLGENIKVKRFTRFSLGEDLGGEE